MSTLSQRKRSNPIYRAWVKNSWRPVYEPREITRGKRRGWLVVTYLAGMAPAGSRHKFKYARVAVPEIKDMGGQ